MIVFHAFRLMTSSYLTTIPLLSLERERERCYLHEHATESQRCKSQRGEYTGGNLLFLLIPLPTETTRIFTCSDDAAAAAATNDALFCGRRAPSFLIIFWFANKLSNNEVWNPLALCSSRTMRGVQPCPTILQREDLCSSRIHFVALDHDARGRTRARGKFHVSRFRCSLVLLIFDADHPTRS